jgi:signal recognition particle subunit SRP54
LVEKAQSQIDEKEAERLEEKMRKNEFSFEDFLDQMKLIKKMGSLRDLLGMLPGVDKALRGVEIDDKAFGRVEAMILSMTKQERQNPRLLNGNRRKRIAAGSGTTIQDVNRLIKQFEDMQKMMRNMTKGKMANMMGNRMPNLPFGARR